MLFTDAAVYKRTIAIEVIEPDNVSYAILQGQLCPNPRCRGAACLVYFRDTKVYRAPRVFICDGCGFWWQPERGTRRLYSWNPNRRYRLFIDPLGL